MSRASSFLRAFLASAAGTAASRVLGALRDIVIAGFLGAGAASDAFLIAFTIPNLFRRFVADEGLTGALIPAIAQADAESEEVTKQLAAQILGVLLVANLILCTAGVLLAKPLVLLFAYSWIDEPEKLDLAVRMTRWMFPFVAFVSFVSYFEGLLNARGHFFTPKIAPGLVSAGIAIGALGFGTSFEEPVFALVAGVMVGGVAHVLVNLPPVWRYWGRPGISFSFGGERLKTVLHELGKVIVIGVFAQINLIVLRQLATSLPDGAVTHYWNANRMVDLSQGIVAVAIGSALLPNISEAVAQEKWTEFRADLVRALRLAAFLIFPVVAVLGAFATPLTSMLFRHGKYTAEAVHATAETLQLMLPFVIAVAGMNIVKKVFFALEDRTTLLWVGAAGVALTGALGLALVGSMGVAGLALALSVATSVQFGIYLLLLHRRLGANLGLSDLLQPIALIVACTIPTMAILTVASGFGSWDEGPLHATNLAVTTVGLGVSGATYLAAAHFAGLPEVRAVTSRLTARFGRKA